MADLVLGLATTTVKATVTMARSAMEEEGKLKKSVQNDLLVISDEFEMMQAFLSDAKGCVTDNVTKTLVRQVRTTALDFEDCIENICHLDNKPHWWRRMMLPWCLPAAAPETDLDAVVANVAQLKARVDAMGLRRQRYNSIDDNNSRKPADDQLAIATGAAKQNLTTLINGEAEGNNSSDDETEGEEYETAEEDEQNTEEVANEAKGPELKVISVLGTGKDLEMMFIKKAYDDSITCNNFKCRAWVKLAHPVNPIEFIRSLLAQFQKNARKKQGNTVQVLDAIVMPDDELIKMFKTKIRQKYLVVLEEVSAMVDWEVVKGYLPDNKDGSCIVVHTRHYGIAFSCVGQQHSVSELEMPLEDHHSLVRVIFKKDVPGQDSDNDKDIEYKIWKDRYPIYGREEDIRWLYDRLHSSYVASVWGISGVGKSFLVEHFYQRVWNRPYLQDHPYYTFFSRRRHRPIWVNVARPFNLRDVRKQLPKELRNPGEEGRDSYIIVIDDLQSTEEWDSIRPFFDESTTPQKNDSTSNRQESSANKKKRTSIVPRGNVYFIIIITNEESVANYCATEKDSVRNIKGLEADDAIKLFNQAAKKSRYYDSDDEKTVEGRHLNQQTRGILLNKCGGFPRVISVAAELSSYFRDIKVQDNLVTKLEANAQPTALSLEGMYSWLLDYFGSCPDSLKPCIFYLTIFPMNHKIRRRRLVRRWIAEGYTWDNKQITAEETANQLFSRLVSFSMIQPPQGQWYLSGFSTRMPLCQVNGFLREYVLSSSMEENFVFQLEGNCKTLQRDRGTNIQYIKGLDMACVVQHLAIDESWDRDKNVFESIDFSRLRSLTVFGRWESFLISEKMLWLRALDLEDVSEGLTDAEVENMVNLLPRLKFLSLRGCRDITRLPSSLGNLKQLQTLDIRKTSVKSLPKSINKLEKLQYIRAGTGVVLCNNDTAGTFGSLAGVAAAAANPSTSATPMRRRAILGSCMSKFGIHHHLYDGPRNGVNVPRGIGNLFNLHTLGVVNISAAGWEDFLGELKNLTLLHKLGVCGINRKIGEKFFSAISSLAHLESLSLQFQLNQDHEAAIRLSPLVKLRSLKLYGLADRLPTWIMQMCSQSQLPRLEKLELQMRKLPQEQLDSIVTLQKLRILRLRLAEFEDEEIRFGWNIPRSTSDEGCLNILEISCNSRLQAVRFASTVEVVILKIECSSVSSSLKFFGLQTMSKLKEVWLSGSYGAALEKHLTEELADKKKKDDDDDDNDDDIKVKRKLQLKGTTSLT